MLCILRVIGDVLFNVVAAAATTTAVFVDDDVTLAHFDY